MSARILRVRGVLRFVFFDSHGEGLPIPVHGRAWRRSIYRPPVLEQSSG